MEAELESEEPMETGGDASTSKDEGDRGIVATLVERREPMAVAAGGGWDMERRSDVPASRKYAVSSDATVEREAKRVRSPRPSEASLASHPPAPSMARHASRSEEHARTPASLGLGRAHDPQRGDARSVAPVGAPRAGGCSDSWAN